MHLRHVLITVLVTVTVQKIINVFVNQDSKVQIALCAPVLIVAQVRASASEMNLVENPNAYVQ